MTTIPRDLPEKPSQPTYYIVNDRITGFGSVFLHQPDGTWMRGGENVPAADVPTNLRPLAVQVTR